MVETDFSGGYTNIENCKEGDVGIVLTEGEIERKTNMKGKEYSQLNIDVEIHGKKLVHSPRMMEGKKLAAAWGSNSKNWIGHKFVCHVVRQLVSGNTKQFIEIEPIEGM